MKVKCVSMCYQPGDYSLGQRVSGGGVPGRTYHKNGNIHEQCGFGYERIIAPSRYVLYVEKDGLNFGVLVDRFFKDTVGRLTEKRRAKIEAAMPDTIHVNVHQGANGKYFVACDSDLNKWKNLAGL